ncbi:hypothetical protein [Streptomyces sp. Y2F8-2]|uniref:hypothetical protein n=1 Tax=Streptomyces sp. Y2F8-2 TaxID=2759675 RepID=UPI0035B50CB8
MAIDALWVIGLVLLNRAGHGLPWREGGDAPDSRPEPRGHSRAKKEKAAGDRGVSTARATLVFSVSALATLVAGVVIERSGEEFFARQGLSGALFGATVPAVATALPEISTGLASTQLGDYRLAGSDIFGGNAFLPVLFLLAGLISGKPALPAAHHTDVYLTALGIILTVVCMAGLVFRPRRRYARMGVDSVTAVIVYAAGIAGLATISGWGRTPHVFGKPMNGEHPALIKDLPSPDCFWTNRPDSVPPAASLTHRTAGQWAGRLLRVFPVRQLACASVREPARAGTGKQCCLTNSQKPGNPETRNPPERGRTDAALPSDGHGRTSPDQSLSSARHRRALPCAQAPNTRHRSSRAADADAGRAPSRPLCCPPPRSWPADRSRRPRPRPRPPRRPTSSTCAPTPPSRVTWRASPRQGPTSSST